MAESAHPGPVEQDFSDSVAKRFSASTYEPFLWFGERRGMRERRRSLLGPARGEVLEIGAGTGLNAELYPDGVGRVVFAEPDQAMARKLRAKVAALRPGSEVVEAPAESLPFEDASFDTVVSTMVLCTVGDPRAAVREIRRVLRPGGRLLFCEHVLSDSPRLARWQRRLAGPWAAFAEGCRCDQDTLAVIEDALMVNRIEEDRWRGMPPLVHPLVVGEATATAPSGS